jgi:ethanolamine kinase
MAKKIQYEDEEKQKAHDAVDIGAMEAELALTEKKSAQLESPIVWSHNDLLSGNVLVSKQVWLL